MGTSLVTSIYAHQDTPLCKYKKDNYYRKKNETGFLFVFYFCVCGFVCVCLFVCGVRSRVLNAQSSQRVQLLQRKSVKLEAQPLQSCQGPSRAKGHVGMKLLALIYRSVPLSLLGT